jgi:hypothetical protein
LIVIDIDVSVCANQSDSPVIIPPVVAGRGQGIVAEKMDAS